MEIKLTELLIIEYCWLCYLSFYYSSWFYQCLLIFWRKGLQNQQSLLLISLITPISQQYLNLKTRNHPRMIHFLFLFHFQEIKPSRILPFLRSHWYQRDPKTICRRRDFLLLSYLILQGSLSFLQMDSLIERNIWNIEEIIVMIRITSLIKRNQAWSKVIERSINH